MPAAQISV